MRKLIVPTTILLTIVSCSPQEENHRIEQRIQRIENGLVAMSSPSLAEQFNADRIRTADKVTLSERMANYNVPGVSIAVINDYRVEWTKDFGVVKAGSDKPVTPETCFEAASTTKLLTSAAALHFSEQGILELDEDVNKKLKSWKIPENEFTQKEKVTLRRLLTHQSGLTRPDGGFSEEEGSVPTLIQVLKGEAPAKNQAAFVEYVPGTKHQYSNMGYIVIQLLLEDVMGIPYPQIVQETIFGPIGMKNSTMVHPLHPEFKSHVALPHDEQGNSYDRPQHPTALGHAALVATPADLAFFTIELIRAYQGKSSRIVSQKMAKKMFSVQLEIDPNQFFGLSGQGLGVFLMGVGDNFYFTYPGHNAPGATCVLIASPGTGKGAVIMTNGVNGLQLSLEILAAVGDEYDWPAVQYKD
ncbi:MAG: serine hydrolase [Candidatus Aminicenantes bacterium]|nr:serine hydrolase [Candidatus Aminicenantes bacterium]